MGNTQKRPPSGWRREKALIRALTGKMQITIRHEKCFTIGLGKPSKRMITVSDHRPDESRRPRGESQPRGWFGGSPRLGGPGANLKQVTNMEQTETEMAQDVAATEATNTDTTAAPELDATNTTEPADDRKEATIQDMVALTDAVGRVLTDTINEHINRSLITGEQLHKALALALSKILDAELKARAGGQVPPLPMRLKNMRTFTNRLIEAALIDVVPSLAPILAGLGDLKPETATGPAEAMLEGGLANGKTGVGLAALIKAIGHEPSVEYCADCGSKAECQPYQDMIAGKADGDHNTSDSEDVPSAVSEPAPEADPAA